MALRVVGLKTNFSTKEKVFFFFFFFFVFVVVVVVVVVVCCPVRECFSFLNVKKSSW